jgi:predicted metal-dependent phosphoesterase TrpH
MIIQQIDLHSHTLHSDGTLTPSELVALAGKCGLRALALTDHDTTGGLDEALRESARAGLEVVPGIEVSVQYDPGTMHILGYFIDYRSEKLQERLKGFQDARRNRNPQIIKKLNELGVDVTLEEVIQESGGDQVGRPHFARVLIRKKYARDIPEAFAKYLAKGAPAYVDKRHLPPEDGIRMIADAGGIAVLAHPKQLRAKSEAELDAVLDRLVGAGLKGIEAYSSSQDEKESRGYREAGERRGLFITGGSDFHGGNKAQVELGRMGDWADVPYELVEAMKRASGRGAGVS